MTKEEITKKARENYFIHWCEVRIKENTEKLKNTKLSPAVLYSIQKSIEADYASIEQIKQHTLRPDRCTDLPAFSRLTPGRGYLKIMQCIDGLSKSLTKIKARDILEYSQLMFHAKIDNMNLNYLVCFKIIEKSADCCYSLTDFGREILKAYGL